MAVTPKTYLRRTRTIAAKFNYKVLMTAKCIDMYMDSVWGYKGVSCDDKPGSAYAMVPFDRAAPLRPSNAFPLTKEEAMCYMKGTLDMPPEIMSRIGDVMQRIRDGDDTPYVPVRPPAIILSSLPEKEHLRLANECFAYGFSDRRELGAPYLCLVQIPDPRRPNAAFVFIRR